MCTQSFHPECLQLTEADLDTILKQPHFICSECSENEQVQSEHQDLCVGACSYCIPYLVSIALNKTPLKTLFLFSQRKRSCICWNSLSMLTKYNSRPLELRKEEVGIISNSFFKNTIACQTQGTLSRYVEFYLCVCHIKWTRRLASNCLQCDMNAQGKQLQKNETGPEKVKLNKLCPEPLLNV